MAKDLDDPVDHDKEQAEQDRALATARRLEEKAMICLSIAFTAYPGESDEKIEDVAVELMAVPRDVLEALAKLVPANPVGHNLCGQSKGKSRYDIAKVCGELR